MYPFNVIILFFIFLSHSFTATANERLIWLSDTGRIVDNFYSIKRSSLGIETTRLLLKNMNLTNVEIKIAKFSKISELMKEKSSQTYCVADRIKNPTRERTQIFSQPIYLYPNLKVYYQNKQQVIPQGVLNKEEELISLPALFRLDSEYVLDIEENRSYGVFIDQQIALIPKENINIHTLKGRHSVMIAMLLRKKINFTLLFPTEFNKKITLLNKQNYTIKSLAIAGNPRYIFSRIACSKTTLGQKVINDINVVLNELYLSPYFDDIHKKFLPKDVHAQFKKDLGQLIQDNALL